MPTITLLGWLHTILGVFAILTGVYTLAKNKVIETEKKSGKIYLLSTLITALTALGIYHQGGFNMAHILAILTLLAVLVGIIADKYKLFGGLSSYVQAVCFSSTLLFHMIPAITDGLMRLPVEAPIVSDIQDPLLLKFYLFFLATYFLGVIMQISYLRK